MMFVMISHMCGANINFVSGWSQIMLVCEKEACRVREGVYGVFNCFLFLSLFFVIEIFQDKFS